MGEGGKFELGSNRRSPIATAVVAPPPSRIHVSGCDRRTGRTDGSAVEAHHQSGRVRFKGYPMTEPRDSPNEPDASPLRRLSISAPSIQAMGLGFTHTNGAKRAILPTAEPTASTVALAT